jgi:spermidine synthase
MSRLTDIFELILISSVILFLELACIRWFPAHVLYLTFFTNVVLLASFLGMSVGCLAASRSRSYLRWTPVLLVIALVVAHVLESSSNSFMRFVDVGNQTSPQQVYFGTEYHTGDLSRFAIPVELICGFFFIIIALTFIGPGQELGRALKRWPNRIHAYTLNIVGSIAGILLFAACSWLELPPFAWFFLVAVAISWFFFISPHRLFSSTTRTWGIAAAVFLVTAVVLSGFTQARVGQNSARQIWSPYYRIDFNQSDLSLSVNLIHHQQMVSRNERFPAYALPHLLNRDSGGQPFADVLIIGAGSGNDVSRALQWGAKHVDAVEIDPAIYRLGRLHHPDRPYDDERVQIHLDDGRNFLRATNRQYDLVVYALVDSLVLHSGYSNIRLESFLFTDQTFADVRRHLKPGGVFVIYNYFRQGWVAARLQAGLERAFGAGNPLVLTLPHRDVIEADKSSFGDFTIFLSGATSALRSSFERQPLYVLQSDQPPNPDSPNGFQQSEAVRTQINFDASKTDHLDWQRFGLATVIPPKEALRTATDDWPFLYLRKPMVPTLSWRGVIIMAVLSLLLILAFVPSTSAILGRAPQTIANATRDPFSLRLQVFFLGAGFLLIETKAVVTMALLFGSTWIVNSVVFLAVLLMILFANLWTARLSPSRLWAYYIGLMITLLLNCLIPLDFFLGMTRVVQVVAACALVFAPIFFAAVIFASAFKRTSEPDQALGINIAGAMVGGLAEYSSMLLGFQYLVLVAVAFYAFSSIGLKTSLHKKSGIPPTQSVDG